MTNHDVFVQISRSHGSGPAAAAALGAGRRAPVAVQPSWKRFLMTGTNAIVRPLSPQDWSTG